MNITNSYKSTSEKNYIHIDKNDPYYKCFFQDIMPPMLIINPDTAEIVDANNCACLFYQYSYEDIIKLKIIDINILSPEQIRYEMELAENEKRNHFHFKHRLSNSEIRDVEVLCNPINIDGNRLLMSKIYLRMELSKEEISINALVSKEINMLVSTIDNEINKRVLAEEALKESEARFRSLFENIQLGFALHEVITDDNGEAIDFKCLLINKSYEKLMNQSYDEVVGKTMLEINPAADKEMIKKYCSVGLTGIPIHFEYFSKSYNKYLSVNAFSAELGRFAAVFEDISEIKNLEKELIMAKDIAEKASVTKSEFIANMSHELRTPINVVFGAIQLFELYLRSDSVVKKEKYETHLASMKQNCFRLLRIVNNLIDTTKIDSGFYEPSFDNHNIVELIESISLSVSEYAKQKHINLTFQSTAGDLYIACDIDMIERIMLNLISNAIKFTKDMINIRVIKCDNTIAIIINDNGEGIEQDKQKIIFERYKQASNFLNRENEGSGIGLSLTKTLIEMHGGSISVKSDYGKGCEFKIELPIKAKISEVKKAKNTNYISDNERFIEKMKVEFSDIYK